MLLLGEKKFVFIIVPTGVSVFLHVLFGVDNVVGGIVGLAGSYGLEVLGRHAAPYLVRRNLCVLQYQGTGSHDGAFAHLAAVEQGSAHADKGAVVDGAGMYGDVVADGHVAADMGGTRVVGHMDAGAVLHVGTVADGDGGHVAAHDGVEPHRALVAHGHVAHDSGILAKIAVSPPLGSETAVTLNQSHE